MKNLQTCLLATAVIAMFISAGCKKTDNSTATTIPNPTTLQLIFAGSGKPDTFSYRKVGSIFTTDSIIIQHLASYAVTTVVLDQSVTPAIDLTATLGDVNPRNYIFYEAATFNATAASGDALSLTNWDNDDLGFPYRRHFTAAFYANAGATGTFQVSLVQGSDKTTGIGGTQLINVTFPFRLL